jgi:hypothetical protein
MPRRCSCVMCGCTLPFSAHCTHVARRVQWQCTLAAIGVCSLSTLHPIPHSHRTSAPLDRLPPYAVRSYPPNFSDLGAHAAPVILLTPIYQKSNHWCVVLAPITTHLLTHTARKPRGPQLKRFPLNVLARVYQSRFALCWHLHIGATPVCRDKYPSSHMLDVLRRRRPCTLHS